MRGSIILVLLLASVGALGYDRADERREDRQFRYDQLESERRYRNQERQERFNRDRDAKLEGLRAQDEALVEQGRQLEEQMREIQDMITKKREELNRIEADAAADLKDYQKALKMLEGEPPRTPAEDVNLTQRTARTLRVQVTSKRPKDATARLDPKRSKFTKQAFEFMVDSRMLASVKKPMDDFGNERYWVQADAERIKPADAGATFELRTLIPDQEREAFRNRLGLAMAQGFDLPTAETERTTYIGGFATSIQTLSNCYTKKDDELRAFREAHGNRAPVCL